MRSGVSIRSCSPGVDTAGMTSGGVVKIKTAVPGLGPARLTLLRLCYHAPLLRSYGDATTHTSACRPGHAHGPIPLAFWEARRPKGGSTTDSDRLTLKALAIMSIRRVYTAYALLACLAQGDPEAQLLRPRLHEQGRFASPRRFFPAL
jgi:hypothetical protein